MSVVFGRGGGDPPKNSQSVVVGVIPKHSLLCIALAGNVGYADIGTNTNLRAGACILTKTTNRLRSHTTGPIPGRAGGVVDWEYLKYYTSPAHLRSVNRTL